MTLTLRQPAPLLRHSMRHVVKDNNYTVSQLAELSGVSVRTLHLYDELNLLKPSARTAAGYRLYGEAELLRLQQILLYRQLDFSLADIREILDDPHFDLIRALEQQKTAFQQRLMQLSELLETIDQTIHYLQAQGIMTNLEFLYQGIPKETADAWQKQAAATWKEEYQRSIEHLSASGRPQVEQLKQELVEVGQRLFSLRALPPSDAAVQDQIARHYFVIRGFWGTAGSKDLQAEAYAGLGQLYVADDRYLMQEGVAQPEFARFMSEAMAYFAKTQL